MDLNRFFDRRLTETYTCYGLACDLWAEITGEDLAARLSAGYSGRVSLAGARSFTQLPRPLSPCLVLMERPASEPHIGIFYQGKVLHLSSDGVVHRPMDVATRGFQTVRFYQ